MVPRSNPMRWRYDVASATSTRLCTTRASRRYIAWWWCCVCTDDENPKAIKGGANKLESLSFPLHLPAERIHRRVIMYAIHSTSAALRILSAYLSRFNACTV